MCGGLLVVIGLWIFWFEVLFFDLYIVGNECFLWFGNVENWMLFFFNDEDWLGRDFWMDKLM